MVISADTPSKLNTDNGGMILDDGLLLVGIAVSWENRDAYYIALTHEEPEGIVIIIYAPYKGIAGWHQRETFEMSCDSRQLHLFSKLGLLLLERIFSLRE